MVSLKAVQDYGTCTDIAIAIDLAMNQILRFVLKVKVYSAYYGYLSKVLKIIPFLFLEIRDE